jgi:pentatricopeptide repeat protein
MVDGYMRNGEVEDAIELFDQMPKRDAISWATLIGGFVKKGHDEQALVWLIPRNAAPRYGTRLCHHYCSPFVVVCFSGKDLAGWVKSQKGNREREGENDVVLREQRGKTGRWD